MSPRAPLGLTQAVVVSVDETWRARDRLLLQLDPEERAALEALPFEPRRRERLAGRLAGLRAVQRASGLPMARIAIHRSEDPSVRGRPEVALDGRPAPEWFVSIAHAGGLAVARVDRVPIGIDLEVVEPREAAFEALVFTELERRALVGLQGAERDAEVTRRFALKEATGKMWGVGLARAFSELEPPEGAEVLTRRARFADRVLIYAEVREVLGWAASEAGAGAAV